MYVNKCTKCGAEFETKNPKRVICPGCLYPDRKPLQLDSFADTTAQPPAQENKNEFNEKPQEAPQQRGEFTRGPQEGGYDRRPQQGGQGGYDRRPQGGGYGRPQQGGYDRRPQQGGYGRPQQGGYDRRPQQGGYDRRPQGGGYGRPQGGGGYDRPQQGGYDRRPQGGGGYDRRPQGGGYDRRPQGGPGGGFRRPQGGGGFRRPEGGGGGFRRSGPPRPAAKKSLLISKDQVAEIERKYKSMLPLPNPDAHEVIGKDMNLEPNKVFFGINLVRQKMMLPKLPYPKRKLAVSPDQLMAIQSLYAPLLPLPPIGCHKFISRQLKMDEWRVHVGIGIIRKQMNLPRWNPDREDAPEEFKNQPKEEVKPQESDNAEA